MNFVIELKQLRPLVEYVAEYGEEYSSKPMQQSCVSFWSKFNKNHRENNKRVILTLQMCRILKTNDEATLARTA